MITLKAAFPARTAFASDRVEILAVTDDRRKKTVAALVELGADPSFHYSVPLGYETAWSETDLEAAIRAFFANGG